MEWVILNPTSIHETFGLLGFIDKDGNYHIKETCDEGLTVLLTKLESDGQYFGARRSLGLTKVVEQDLIPLLIQAGAEKQAVLPKLIKLLSQLTLPTECLLNQDFSETEEGHHVAFEIESLLSNVKHEFSRFKATEVIVEFLKIVSQKIELSPEECREVADALLLLRNVLHISVKEAQVHNQILWNLFAHNLDKILLHLMTCDQKHWWGVSLVQLISLIYKDQHVSNLQKLLTLWLENSLSESSEDNESNTSPKFGNSSPMLTSDPTSDSSDTGGNGTANKSETSSTPVVQPKCYTKVKKVKSRPMDADSGVSLQESDDICSAKLQDSTSSNEEENNRPQAIWSPPASQEKQRKKLHKRIKRSTLKQHHHPTEEDISHILKEFTVHFLLKGYGSLVTLLQDQLSRNEGGMNEELSITMDKSHYLWLITYFLKFATQLELDLDVISSVLNSKTLSYLTFEGVVMCENLAVCKDDVKPHLRRMHLVVTSIKEFIMAVDTYSKIPTDDKSYITKLQIDMIEIRQLRYLFLLLIRSFKPGLQSKQYLQDVVTTNHTLLLLLERISKNPDYKGSFQMLEFIREFSTPIIMQQYGHLLEDFEKNGEFVNDCIFTMMHHVAGDLNLPDALFQPLILKTFSNIWEVEFEIRDDWADLIEYVIQRFMKASREEKRQIFKSGTSNISEDTGFTKEEIEKLYWLYCTGAKTNDPIGTILEAYKPSSGMKTRESVLNQLLHQRIIGYNQFLQFLSCERLDCTTEQSSTDGSIKDPLKFSLLGPVIECNKMVQSSNSVEGDLGDLLGQTRNDGFDTKWIQEQVLDVCHAKLILEGKLDPDTLVQPVGYHFSLLGQSVPAVPWTKKQEYALQSSSVILLLHKLGFHLANDVGKLYPRIPHFWTPDVLYSVAEKLGTVGELKFDASKIGDLPVNMTVMEYTAKFMSTGPMVPNFVDGPCPPLDWMSIVQKSKMMGAGAAMLDEEHMDECASLTALPPTEVSENVSMTSDDDEPCEL